MYQTWVSVDYWTYKLHIFSGIYNSFVRLFSKFRLAEDRYFDCASLFSKRLFLSMVGVICSYTLMLFQVTDSQGCHLTVARVLSCVGLGTLDRYSEISLSNTTHIVVRKDVPSQLGNRSLGKKSSKWKEEKKLKKKILHQLWKISKLFVKVVYSRLSNITSDDVCCTLIQFSFLIKSLEVYITPFPKVKLHKFFYECGTFSTFPSYRIPTSSCISQCHCLPVSVICQIY